MRLMIVVPGCALLLGSCVATRGESAIQRCESVDPSKWDLQLQTDCMLYDRPAYEKYVAMKQSQFHANLRAVDADAKLHPEKYTGVGHQSYIPRTCYGQIYQGSSTVAMTCD